MIIGLTGGIATGKTTVSNFLKKMGAEVINTDEITHMLLKKGNIGWEKVIKKFGKYILTKNGEIDRFKLGKIVFKNSHKLRQLENILHPIIINIVRKKIINCKNEHLIVEVPLLYETGMENMFDQVWVVYTDLKKQVDRAKQRSNLEEKEILNRMRFQIPLQEKKRRADILIDNNDSEKELKSKVKKIWNNLS